MVQHSLPAGTATRVPVPGSIGASVQPCTRFGTGYGGWVWLRPCLPPAGSNSGATAPWATTGGRGDGSPRGCARVSRRLQRSARRVRCPTRERGRGRARSEAPSREAPANRRTGTAARAATQEQERSRVLFVVGRCSSSASSRSPFTRWAGKAAWDLRGGCRKKAGHRGGTRNARGSSGGRPSGRERRSGERAAGRSG